MDHRVQGMGRSFIPIIGFLRILQGTLNPQFQLQWTITEAQVWQIHTEVAQENQGQQDLNSFPMLCEVIFHPSDTKH